MNAIKENISLLFISLLWACSSPSVPEVNFNPSYVFDQIHLDQKHALFFTADSLKYLGKYSDAIQTFQALHAKTTFTPEEKNYLDNQLAFCFLQLRVPKKAKQFLQVPQRTDQALMADYLLNQGLYLLQTGEGVQAIEQLNDADSIYHLVYHSQHFRVLQCHLHLSRAYRKFFEKTDLALHHAKQAYQLLPHQQHNKGIAPQVYLAQAETLRLRRDYVQVLTLCDLSLKSWKQADIPIDTATLMEATILNAHALKKLDRKKEATEVLRKEIAFFEKTPQGNQYLMDLYEAQILLFLHLKDANNFQKYLQKLRKRFDLFPVARQHPDCLQAYYEYHNGSPKKSIQLYRQLLKKYEGTENHNQKFFDEAYFLLQELYMKKGQLDSMAYFIDRSAALQLPNEMYQKCWINKDFNSLLFYPQESRRMFAMAMGSKAKLYSLFFLKHPTQLKIGFQALGFHSKANILFLQNNNLEEEHTLYNFFKTQLKPLYENALEVVFKIWEITGEQQYLQQAHLFMERLKYSVLQQELLQNMGHASIPQAHLKEEKRITQRLKELKRITFDKANDLSPAQSKELLRLLIQQKQINQKAKDQSPDYYLAKYHQEIPELTAIQNKLGQDQQRLLQYHISKSYVYRLLISPQKIILKRSPINEHFDTIYHRFLSTLSDDGNAFELEAYQQYLSDAQYLYQLFFDGLEEDWIPNGNVIVCPDATYPILPFGALLKEAKDSTDINYADLPYLINHYTFQYILSIKSYWLIQQKQLNFSANTKVLAFAFSEARTNLIAGNLRTTPLAEIYGTSKELKAIEAIMKNDGSNFFYGQQSNRQQFLDHCEADYDIIHLALHAKADLLNPYANKFYFKHPELSDSTEVLYGHQISDKNIQAPLVVLSACETGAGQRQTGEGTYSLMRSILASGAKQVVSTQWPIDDQIMQQIMSAFYQHLKDGDSVTVALKKSKQAYLKNADQYLSFPGFWAGVLGF